MSVAFVVLRLEIADNYPLLPSLHFSATNKGVNAELKEDELVQKSYAKALSGNGTHSEELLERFRGFREFQSISIASYTAKELELEIKMAEKEKNKDSATDEADDENKTMSHTEAEVTIATHSQEVFPSTSLADRKTNSHAMSSSSKERLSTSPPSESRQSPTPECRFTPISEDINVSRPGSASSRKRIKSHSPTSKNPSIHFFSGNPSVEITEGILHLYKDGQMTSLTEDVDRSEMLCMLAVPASMMVKDLLQFLAPVYEWIEFLKVIRDSTPNQYMVLLTFQRQKHADDFYRAYNNTKFNSIEDDLCRMVYVAKVETVKSSHGGSLPVPGLTELPTCPVCLERMDESVDGILMILCNHSFHGSCLAQWSDTSCPVCRYIQTPIPTADNKCFQCLSTDSLWICLICGHVGCGRYVGGHARSHFEETQHTYSLQLGNNRVWDYVGDNYVHRLIQNKGDGKLVEVDEGGNIVEQDEKIDSLTLEYTYLLTSQLESQRCYFEEKMTVVEQDACKQMEEVEMRSKAMIDQCSRLEKQLTDVTREKHGTEKKMAQVSSKVNKLEKDLLEEQALNKSLLQNQEQWQSRVSVVESLVRSKDEELKDVQEQLRDVMFYLEAQQKLANTTEVSQEEIQDSHIVVGSSSQGAQGGKKRKKKKVPTATLR